MPVRLVSDSVEITDTTKEITGGTNAAARFRI